MILAKIVFCTLAAVSGALLGMVLSRLFIKQKGFGALGAFLGYAMGGLLVGLGVAFLLMNKIAGQELFIANIVLGVLSLGVIIWIAIQVQKNRRNNDPNDGPPTPERN